MHLNALILHILSWFILKAGLPSQYFDFEGFYLIIKSTVG